jgi:hemerythrin superfamily protein
MASRASPHALAVLLADHKVVGQLLVEYDELACDQADAEERASLAQQICDALTAHAAAEEDVLYPVARAALEDDELIDMALCEHDGVRALVDQIETLDADNERFDALMLVLARAVARHVQTEERLLFPRLENAGLDLEGLGARIVRRRDEELLRLSGLDN